MSLADDMTKMDALLPFGGRASIYIVSIVSSVRKTVCLPACGGETYRFSPNYMFVHQYPHTVEFSL